MLPDPGLNPFPVCRQHASDLKPPVNSHTVAGSTLFPVHIAVKANFFCPDTPGQALVAELQVHGAGLPGAEPFFSI